MPYSAIGPIAIHLPEKVESIDQLSSMFAKWDMETIYRQDGRADPTYCRARSMRVGLGGGGGGAAFQAARHRPQIDRLSPVLHANARLSFAHHGLHHAGALGLPTSIGALDFNLGCSGFVYGLSMADGLIRSGIAQRVLLITAETYSKYIDPSDRSLRTIFGDGAAATLVEASDEPSLGKFVFGTDGRGANTLMVTEGGARSKEKRDSAQQAQTLAQQPVYGRAGTGQVLPRSRAADDRAAVGPIEMDPR